MMINSLDTLERRVKPRNYGIKSLIDNGVPTRYFKDVIDSNESRVCENSNRE